MFKEYLRKLIMETGKMKITCIKVKESICVIEVAKLLGGKEDSWFRVNVKFSPTLCTTVNGPGQQ